MTTASVDTTIRLIAAGELAGETCTPELAEAPWAFDAAPPSYGPGASMADPIPPQTPTPEEWREFARLRTEQIAPRRMTDGTDVVEVNAWANGFDPASPVDQAVLATRRAVFPEHGLDPMTDE